MSIEYVMIGTNDLDRARQFYDAVFPAIGGVLDVDYPGMTFGYKFRNGTRAWVARPNDQQSARAANGSMPGFGCASPGEVDAAYAAALAQGGTCEGQPGPRPIYGPNVYAAYVRDLDGNKMSFIHDA
ncbi:MAG: VOC family protein [Novosphingobium sp.]|jgi:catechol 2,3-dioxygenase-like lactoylglutathione lyase family enzyme|nr:VOC family protein [Novosphingobium sp.]